VQALAKLARTTPAEAEEALPKPTPSVVKPRMAKRA
jgi:hypothetical protein